MRESNRRTVARIDRFDQFLPIGPQAALRIGRNVPAQDRVVISGGRIASAAKALQSFLNKV